MLNSVNIYLYLLIIWSPTKYLTVKCVISPVARFLKNIEPTFVNNEAYSRKNFLLPGLQLNVANPVPFFKYI